MTEMLDSPLPARFSSYIAQLRQDGDGSQMLHYPGLTSKPWHDPARFPLVRALESAAKQIALEASAIDARAFHRETRANFTNGQLGRVLSIRSRSPS